jgi:hypothetical protein
MTAEELAWTAWEWIGEPTDLDPDSNPVDADDPFASNEEKWLYYLNRAADAVATYKAGNRRHFRYKNDDLIEIFAITPTTVFTTSAAFENTSAYMTTSGLVQDALKNYVLVENTSDPSEYFKCVGNTTTNVYTDRRPSSTIASSTAIRGAIPRVDLTGTTISGGTQSERVMEVLGVDAHIRDLSGSSGDRFVSLDPLPRRTRNEPQHFYGDPQYYWRRGQYLWLDRLPVNETEVVLHVDIKKFPTEMTAFADEPDIPEAFHWAILQWVSAWGFGRYMDPIMRKDLRGQFREEMETRVTEFMVEFDHNDQIGGKVRR